MDLDQLNQSSSSLLSLVKTSSKSRFYARVTLYVFLFLIPFFLCAPWQQTVLGMGKVVAFAPLDRQQFIEAPIEGRITKWYVMEGSAVKTGDLIVEISDNDPQFLNRLTEEKNAVESRIGALEARADSLKMRINSLSASRDNGFSAARSRSLMAKDRVAAAEHALDATEAIFKTAQLNHNRQKSLYSQGLASQRALEMAEMEEARALTELNRAKAAVSASKSELLAISSDQSKVSTDGSAMVEDARAQFSSVMADLANAKAELPRISARLSRQHSQIVKAPRDGIIMRLIVAQGSEMVKPGEQLAILIPDTDERAAEIWVDGNDVPLITEGREVRIQFQGWPVIFFSGWPDLSFGTYGGHIVLVDNTDNGTGKFRIVVKPDLKKDWPSPKYLRQGVRAHAWIFLNQVSIGYEFWRRFNDFPPFLPMETTLKKKDSK